MVYVKLLLRKGTGIVPVYLNMRKIEKFFIINSIRDNRVLNKRSEFINKCRHQNKYLIKNVNLKDSMD